MKEAAFWSLFKFNMDKLAKYPITRIENVAGSGVFDVYATWQGGQSTWIELKIGKSGWFTVRNSQVSWARQRMAAQAKDMIILVRDEDTVSVVSVGVIMIPPHKVHEERKAVSYRRSELPTGAVIAEFAKPFNWYLIRELIIKCTTRE